MVGGTQDGLSDIDTYILSLKSHPKYTIDRNCDGNRSSGAVGTRGRGRSILSGSLSQKRYI